MNCSPADRNRRATNDPRYYRNAALCFGAVHSPNQYGDREPNADNEQERPEGVGKTMSTGRLCGLPARIAIAFDALNFNENECTLSVFGARPIGRENRLRAGCRKSSMPDGIEHFSDRAWFAGTQPTPRECERALVSACGPRHM
jgi:hypothetical protein